MNINWKKINYNIVSFFLNPLEKYEWRFRILLVIICVAQIFYLNKIFFLFLSFIISSLDTILRKYKKYKYDYHKVNEINENDAIIDVSVFPSGNIIVVTRAHIKIYDNNFYPFQIIPDHPQNLNVFKFVDIKDENNFLAYKDGILSFYTLINNNYILINNMKASHLKYAYFFSKNNLLYSSDDNTKILEGFRANYKIITKLKENIMSSMVIEDKKLLITSGNSGTTIRNKIFKIVKKFEEIKCQVLRNGMANIGKDRIVVLSGRYFYVISLINKDIIKKVNIFMEAYIINYMKGKNFFCIGSANQLFTYDKTNYKYYDNILTEKWDNYDFKIVIGMNQDMYLTVLKDYYAYSVNIFNY